MENLFEQIWQALIQYISVSYLIIFMMLSYLIKRHFGDFLTRIFGIKFKTVYVVLIIATLVGIPFIIWDDESFIKIMITYTLGTSLHETIFAFIEKKIRQDAATFQKPADMPEDFEPSDYPEKENIDNFKSELRKLLKRYNASIECEVDGDTYGLSYKMFVNFYQENKWKDYKLSDSNSIDWNDFPEREIFDKDGKGINKQI